MPLNTNSQGSIDQFNEALRANPEYRAFLQSIGVNPNGPLRLSDSQRRQARGWVRSRYGNVGDLEVDPAGNLNQDEGFSRHAKWMIPAAIGAGTLGFGAAGMGPLAGLFGGSGSAAGAAGASGAAGGLIPSSSIPTSLLMSGPSAASAGLAGAGGAGLAAGAAGAGSNIAQRLLGGGNQLADGSSLLDKILDWAPVGAAAFGAGKQLLQGPPQAQQDLERILALAESRVNQSQPVFDQLNTFVQSRMPNYVKG